MKHMKRIVVAGLMSLVLIMTVGCGGDQALPTVATTEATTVTTEATEEAKESYKVVFEPGVEGLDAMEMTVEEGEEVSPPEFEVPGMNFVGWDKDISDITGDITVTALWEKAELSSVEISDYAETRTATVRVSNAYGNSSSGSGFFIDSDGTFVTNYHVIELADSIEVEMNDGGTYSVNKVINFSEKYDLAVLQVAIKDNDYFELSTEVKKGEQVYAIGSALGELTGTVTGGIVSSPSRTLGKIDCIQMDAAISSGNSGGPLVNVYGEVVGVNSFSFTSGSDLNLAINIAMLEELGEAKDFSVNDYIEWWRTEIERSYHPVNSENTNQYIYSIVNTYQSVTGEVCYLSTDDSTFEEGYEGYYQGYSYYVYEYDTTSYDKYVSYLKDMGFEYDVDASETFLGGNYSLYYSTSGNICVEMYVISDGADMLIISVYY